MSLIFSRSLGYHTINEKIFNTRKWSSDTVLNNNDFFLWKKNGRKTVTYDQPTVSFHRYQRVFRNKKFKVEEKSFNLS